MKRFLAALLFASPLCAQLALHIGSPAGAVVSGSLNLPDTLTTQPFSTTMVLVNTSGGTLTIPNLSVAGLGFTLRDLPSLPQVLGPGASLPFTLSFAPDRTAAFSAMLATGALSTVITAKGIAAVSLSPSTAIDFGSIPYGSPASPKTLTLINSTKEVILFPPVSITGPFRIAAAPFPVSLAPGGSFSLSIQLVITQSGPAAGAIAIGTRTIALTALIGAASLPVPAISFSSPVLQSAMQSSFRITYDEPALVPGTGTVQLAFSPAGDPAAVLLATGKATATFAVAPGDTASPPILFQTGTLAGTLTVTAVLGGVTATATVALAPNHVVVDRVTLGRGASSLDIQLSGFDNTRSASDLHFIFFDAAGKQIGAPISVAASTGFQQYFSTAGLGGMFSLDANFPVTGSAAKVDSVEVELLNSVGITQTPRTKF